MHEREWTATNGWELFQDLVELRGDRIERVQNAAADAVASWAILNRTSFAQLFKVISSRVKGVGRYRYVGSKT